MVAPLCCWPTDSVWSTSLGVCPLLGGEPGLGGTLSAEPRNQGHAWASQHPTSTQAIEVDSWKNKKQKTPNFIGAVEDEGFGGEWAGGRRLCGLPHLILLLHLGDQLLPLSGLAHAHHDEALIVPLGQH